MLAERYLRSRYDKGRQDGKKEGLEEGRTEGRKEGREEERLQWREWNRRREEAVQAGVEFAEPPPDLAGVRQDLEGNS